MNTTYIFQITFQSIRQFREPQSYNKKVIINDKNNRTNEKV